MGCLRYLLSIFFLLPSVVSGQDTVMVNVYGNYNPDWEIAGYHMQFFIDEMNAVCDPYTGKLTPEEQVRIFKDSLRKYGIDLSKFIEVGHGLKYPQFYDDYMGAPHPNVIQRFLLDDIMLGQIRDVQAMAKMLHIETGEIKPILAYPKGVTKETMVKGALEDARMHADLIADVMDMKIVEFMEIHEHSQFDDPVQLDNVFFSCHGSVSVRAVMVAD